MARVTAEGGCRCGAVRYTVEGEAIWSAGCCCRDCARATGTPFVVWVGFTPERVKITSAAHALYESSPGVLRGYCRSCGGALTYGRAPGYEGSEPILYVSAATLDDPGAFPPTEVIWYGQRPGWFSLDVDIPRFEAESEIHAGRAYNRVRRD